MQVLIFHLQAPLSLLLLSLSENSASGSPFKGLSDRGHTVTCQRSAGTTKRSFSIKGDKSSLWLSYLIMFIILQIQAKCIEIQLGIDCGVCNRHEHIQTPLGYFCSVIVFSSCSRVPIITVDH